MRFRDTESCACFFCGGNNRVQVVARDDGAATFAVCATCREKIMTAWSSDVTLTETANTYSEATKQVMSEAAAMTEEAFEEKYLSDVIDRVIFEYVRGYGQTELDGGAMGLLSVMTEKDADVISEHIEMLSDKGLIYSVTGKQGWYGADYPFAGD